MRRVHGAAFLAALALLAGGAGGQADEEDHGIRITAPMDGWALPRDRPVAVSYFAIWPPCSARPPAKACDAHSASARCHAPSPGGGDGMPCETHVSIDGQRVLTHTLAADNQYTFSGVLPAGALPPGAHRISVAIACADAGVREHNPRQAASTHFSVVEPAVWEELGDAGGEDAASEPGRQLPIGVGHDPLPPAVSAWGSAWSSPGTRGRGGAAGRAGVKCAVMVYHANVRKAYEARWMDKSILSILSQTHQDFDIYELNYGGQDSLTDSVVQPHLHMLQGRRYTFLSRPLSSHAAAMNLLLDRIFADGYDVAFNVNVDDYYAPTRFERQLEAIAAGAHLVSSEFVRITADASGTGDHIHLHYQPTYLTTAELFGERVADKVNAHGVREADADDIRAQLALDHNVLCHPGVSLSLSLCVTLSLCLSLSLSLSLCVCVCVCVYRSRAEDLGICVGVCVCTGAGQRT